MTGSTCGISFQPHLGGINDQSELCADSNTLSVVVRALHDYKDLVLGVQLNLERLRYRVETFDTEENCGILLTP